MSQTSPISDSAGGSFGQPATLGGLPAMPVDGATLASIPTSGNFAAAAAGAAGASLISDSMNYQCGDCFQLVTLPVGGAEKASVRCLKCGGRVLYKKRTTRMVQFEAR